jgi:hypothetical protein
MKTANQAIEELQCRIFAYEVMFQSIFSELPDEVKSRAKENIRANFKAFIEGTNDVLAREKVEAAKIIASRITGA